MRSRKAANEHVAEVARRRLELLSAELAQVSRSLPSTTPEGPPPEARGPVAAAGGEHGDPRPATPPTPATRVTPETGVTPQTPVTPATPGRHARRSLGLGDRAVGWVKDRLPATLQGRVQLGSSHLTVVALLVAAALAVTAWWVIRADGAGTPVPAAAPVGRPSLPIVASPTAVPEGSGTATTGQPSSSGSPVVTIDVAGKVRRPGIATLPSGSRVVDALEAAGGARRGVDLTSLNLARVLVDGEQIVVGVPPPGGVAAPAASAPGAAAGATPGSLVSINSATQSQLETLPGVGPVTAAAILQWRTDNGAFTAVDELLEVSGIGEATLAQIAPFVTL